MIRIRMTYFPPIGSEEEPISIEKLLSVEQIAKSNQDLFTLTCREHFEVLKCNSEELGRELFMHGA